MFAVLLATNHNLKVFYQKLCIQIKEKIYCASTVSISLSLTIDIGGGDVEFLVLSLE